MRWRGRRQSDNVVDRRGRGGLGRMGGRRGLGGGAIILLMLVGLVFGKDVSNILGLLLGGGGAVRQSAPANPATEQQQDEAKQFVATILAETEDTWNAVFAKAGRQYQKPQLILYSGMVQSACGVSSAQAGPFYCPGDRKVYIDLSFLHQLRQMGASGDFAFAYVIAHEIGHHVQNLTGIADSIRAEQSRARSKAQANALSVAMELQADCLAGVWINHTEARQSILEEGDIEEGLRAAAAVGDDRILRQAGRSAKREHFTHGSSAERVQWFKQGMRNGDLQACSMSN